MIGQAGQQEKVVTRTEAITSSIHDFKKELEAAGFGDIAHV